MRVLGVLVLAWILIVAAAIPPRPTELTIGIDTAGAVGVTQCRDEDAVVWVRRPPPGKPWSYDAAHEVAHLRQCFSHAPEWWDSMQSGPDSLVLEREAACADSLVAGPTTCNAEVLSWH